VEAGAGLPPPNKPPVDGAEAEGGPPNSCPVAAGPGWVLLNKPPVAGGPGGGAGPNPPKSAGLLAEVAIAPPPKRGTKPSLLTVELFAAGAAVGTVGGDSGSATIDPEAKGDEALGRVFSRDKGPACSRGTPSDDDVSDLEVGAGLDPEAFSLEADLSLAFSEGLSLGAA
jgi:hypothetical protein